jgi:DNA-binding HxlR family transcriptional regulator
MLVETRTLALWSKVRSVVSRVLGRSYERENCSAARALEIVGERWSLLIIRDALFRGRTRFTEFEKSLRLAPNILTSRLERFVAEGIMDRARNSQGQIDYVLTEKGRDFGPVIMALTSWGDQWDAPQGPPVVFRHADCEGNVVLNVQCAECGSTVGSSEIRATPGSGVLARIP